MSSIYEMLMSIRFANPKMAFIQKHQVMNTNWQQLTKIIVWSMETGLITPIDEGTDGCKYECQNPTVEKLISRVLAFGRGDYFTHQSLEIQAILGHVLETEHINKRQRAFPSRDLPIPKEPPKPPSKRRKSK